MINAMKKFLLESKKGFEIMDVVVGAVFITALIPVIKTFIASATNLTATETVLLSLVTLFIVLGFVYYVGKRTGLIKGGK